MDNNIYLVILKLFGNKGIRFTTDDLAKDLGTSKRTIYTYFTSKDEMIEKTIDYVFGDIIAIDTQIVENRDFKLQEKIKLCFQNIPDAYNIGTIIRQMDDLQRYYPSMWKKVNDYLNKIWDPVIHLVEQGIKNNEIEEINTVILRLMLNETLRKLLDYEFIVRNQINFDSGFSAMSNIVLHGLLKEKS